MHASRSFAISATTALVASVSLAACGTRAPLPSGASTGPRPDLPAPAPSLIPTVNIAPAEGWVTGTAPIPAPGLSVTRFADGLDHPRWLLVLPNGDVLVAETNGPPGKSGITGIQGKIMGAVMKKAGAGVPSANRISLLRDADGDGIAELKQPFLTGLQSPFGMALVGNTLYIANTASLVSVPYTTGQTRVTVEPTVLIDLPGTGEFNHHWTKSLLPSADGNRLYIGVGSNSNVGENGMAVEVQRANILEYNIASKALTVFASGLRNPVGLALQPTTGALWAVVNERDGLGNDLVPDYLTSVTRGAFYGWPYSYWGQHLDPRVEPQSPGLVGRALKPDYALGNHVAPLGLAFHQGGAWSGGQPGAIIGLHGSWNRTPPAGYKVAFVPFAQGRATGAMQDLLTGFLTSNGNARGRPVGIAVGNDGGIFIADDVGNTVWRLAPER
ncbi:MAG: sorbosone dehydrogenase family protein [Pseudomonadota bacterium]|nr:sorbosone dehydrogenase family protein [Pseudomonadota bacterium]